MRRGGQKLNGWRVRALPILAGALLPVFAWGLDSTGGGFRLRSTVNSGGAFFQEEMGGGPYKLSGSVGGIDSGISSGGDNKIQAGAQASFYFPKPITTLTAVTLSSESVTLRWKSVGGGTEYKEPVGSYDIRYMEGGGLTQANFHSASKMASPPDPSGGLDSGETTNLAGLKYDTLYDVGIVSLDGDSLKNEAFLGPIASTRTLAPLPVIDTVTPSTKGKITFDYHVDNPFDKSLDFVFEISTKATFTPLFTSAIKEPSEALNQKGNSHTQIFRSLPQNIYFIRVKSVNQAGAPSVWVNSEPITVGDGAPILNAPSALTAESVHISWVRDPEFLDSKYRVQYSMFDDFSIPNYFPLSAQKGLASATVPSLLPNTTYYFRVLTTADPAPPSSTVSAVTHVHKAQSVSATDIYQTSATVTWADHPLNGTDPHSFRLLVSSDSDFLSDYRSFDVPYSGPSYSQKVDELIPNTTYYVRVMAKNRADIDSIEGNASSIFVTTPVPLSVGSVSKADVAENTRQVKVAWVDPNNSDRTRHQVDLSRDSFATVDSSAVVGPGVHDYLFQSNNGDAPGVPVLANTHYWVRVRPIVMATGLPMATGGDQVEINTKPIPPQDLLPVPSKDSIALSWTGTKGAAKNNPLTTKYGLEWTDLAVGEVGKLVDPKTVLFATASPLHRNTPYALKVTAQSIEGVGYDVSSSTDKATLSDPTGVPEADSTPTTMTVKWDVGGNPIGTRYRVSLSTDTDFSDDPNFVVTESSKIFSPLDSNRKFYFQVNAINSVGVETEKTTSNAYTLPMTPLISSVARTPSQLTFDWNPQTNFPGTKYLPVLDSVTLEARTTVANSLLFSGFTPNSRHNFQVGAKSDVGLATAFSISTSVWTRAETPLAPILDRIVDLGTFYIKFFLGSNPPDTEYAVQVVQDPDNGDPLNGKFLDFLPLPPPDENTTIAPTLAGTPVWRTLGAWGTPQLTGYRLKLKGVPTDGSYFLQLKARNKEGLETEFGERMKVYSISGVPSVKLLEESGSKVIAVATDTDKVPLYLNWRNLRFMAQGSGHFNVSLDQVPDPEGLDNLMAHLEEPSNSHGWNGVLIDGSNCGKPPEDPFFAEAMPGFCAPGEGIYYFHIIGNRINGVSLSDSYKSTPSLRVFIDLTPPLAGAVEASSNNYPIVSDGPTLGLTTLNFSWPVTDGGEASSRSPIVGWSYSFSLNNSTRVPTFDRSGGFVVGPSVSLDLDKAIGGEPLLPSTGTYTFKVRGVDKAGNWQSEPAVFTYNFKADSNPPSFKGVTIGGAKMPKAGFRYAAVPVNAPIQINFSEPMNFSPALRGIQFIQTHNASGKLHDPLVLKFDARAEERGGSTAMMVEREGGLALEPGSRYEIHSSTSNLFDLGGNRLPPDQKFDIVFFTQMDPSVFGVFETEDGSARVTVAAGALGTKPSGVAFDGNVKNDSMKVGEMVRHASGLVSTRSGGAFNQVLDTVEYNQFGADGTLFHSPFLGPVTLHFKYRDENKDGIEDRSAPGHPIKVAKLAIYGLDEETGVWLRMPGSRVEAGEVTVDLRHFSAYALMGAGDFDLTDAHVYPVPFRAKKDNSITFVFPHAQMATVKIYTLDGKLVKTLSDDKGTGFVRWDPVVNEDGDPVGSDVYLYVIENDQQRKVGKLMVIR